MTMTLGPLATTTLAALALLAMTGSGRAQCYDPGYPPNCTDTLFSDTFDSEWEFDQCRREVNGYVQDLQMWADCAASEAERVMFEAQQRADEAVRDFNCKADGGGFCY